MKQLFYLLNRIIRPLKIRLDVIVPENTDQTGNFSYWFVSKYVYLTEPKTIMNIGSHRKFILGLSAYHDITTIDLEDIKYKRITEEVLKQDVKQLKFADNTFDLIFAIGSMGYLGLGKYGQETDQEAPEKALSEIKRVLKPDGLFIFNLNFGEDKVIKGTKVYSKESIKNLCKGLKLVEEHIEFGMYNGCYQKI